MAFDKQYQFIQISIQPFQTNISIYKRSYLQKVMFNDKKNRIYKILRIGQKEKIK